MWFGQNIEKLIAWVLGLLVECNDHGISLSAIFQQYSKLLFLHFAYLAILSVHTLV
jgi:hypothetical protein